MDWVLDALLKKYSTNQVIDTLSHFLSQERIKKIDRVLANRIGSVQIGVERPCDIHNAFAIIRTAEGLGIFQIHFINAQIKKREGKGTAKGTVKWVYVHNHPSFQLFDQNKGPFLLVGACPNTGLDLDSLPLDRPLCFLFGNEKEGLSEEAKNRCDFLFHLPLFGMVESYNLSVAAALALYDFLKRKRGWLQKHGDLNHDDIMKETARCYIRSLGIELSNKILQNASHPITSDMNETKCRFHF